VAWCVMSTRLGTTREIHYNTIILSTCREDPGANRAVRRWMSPPGSTATALHGLTCAFLSFDGIDPPPRRPAYGLPPASGLHRRDGARTRYGPVRER
jgi:hypothetical protein